MKRGDAEWVGIGEALEETRQSETSASEGKQTAAGGAEGRGGDKQGMGAVRFCFTLGDYNFILWLC